MQNDEEKHTDRHTVPRKDQPEMDRSEWEVETPSQSTGNSQMIT